MREKLYRLVDELDEAEVEAALVRLAREHEALQHWARTSMETRRRTLGRCRMRARRSAKSCGSPQAPSGIS